MKCPRFFAVAALVLTFICRACEGTTDLPEPQPTVSTAKLKVALEGFKYIKAYYMVDNGKTGPAVPAVENLHAVMKDVQKVAGLEQTGEIDEPTARVLRWPRCGNNDTVRIDVSEEGERKKRYIVSGPRYKWTVNDLTYKLKNYPNMSISIISSEEVDEAVATAFKLWSDVTPLTFTRVPATSQADIVLSFGKRKHTDVRGDPPFDGPGGTLAHAFTPNSGWGNLNGDVHYDDDETFTHKKYYGRNLLYVTAHELGHALGLDHSNTKGALMWPFILSYTPNYQLPDDDKQGIQAIYGPNPNPPEPEPAPTIVPPPTTPAPTPVYCNLTFDDVEIIRGEIYAFRGKKFWRFSVDGHLVSNAEGTKIQTFFKNVPTVLNGIVERWYDEKVLFIKGKKVWTMSGVNLENASPQYLSKLVSKLKSP